ncbi:MAG TPA: hypothetical protein VFK05_23720 [Polyangiaceae bacterium]|nr:hypothetical protein [Polyangiaceae bacterium]
MAHHAISKLLLASALAAATGVFSVAACTHTSDRVVEPPGGPDASTNSPAVEDSGAAPIGPIAHPPGVEDGEPADDFRLVRAPEFGAPIRMRPVEFLKLRGEPLGGGLGGFGSGGSAGFAGSDLRPVVSCGGGKS